MKSVMNHNFTQIPAPQIERSVFDRSHGYKTTFDAGYLIPFFIDEILPGDTMKLQATLFGRLSTLVFPIMDNVFLDTFYFYVPNRLVWENWERFNGAQDNPSSSIDYEIPSFLGDPLQFASGSLGDYFGLPTLVDFAVEDFPSVLPFRAYNLIWNQWFRDQNIQDSIDQFTGDGPDTNNYSLQRRGKRHDYFTSCLPWPQRGDAVSLPLGVTAPVRGDGKSLGLMDGVTGLGGLRVDATGIARASLGSYGDVLPGDDATGPLSSANIGVTSDITKSGLVADLSLATAATVNQLREAFAFQKILERDARGGTRYVELLRAHFGVTSPDFRLQRPEYLGGSSQRISVSQVAQSSETGTTPQANLSAFGTVGAQSGFNKSFVEHGYVIGLVNVRADITYQGGINRMWSRKTRFDFYLPALAHLGEQAVLNRELHYDNGGTEANVVFGYQERWAEYRYYPSLVTGKFRSNATGGSLDAWHLALDFDDYPALTPAFIVDDPPIDRVVAVPAEPHVILDTYFSIKHARPMPVYSVPGQIDRF